MIRAAILGFLAIVASGAADAQARDRLNRIDRIDRADRAARLDRNTARTIERLDQRATRPDQPPSDPLLSDRRLARARDGFAARRGEILALDLSDTARAAALDAGMRVITESQIGGGVRLARLAAPPPLDAGAMLDLLRATDPRGVFDFNHAFMASGPAPQVSPSAPRSRTGDPEPGLRLGMVDGGVLASHPDLATAAIRQRAFPGDSSLAPTDHGTAVAGRLAETLGAPFTLLVADVLTETGAAWTGADALAAGLAWLGSENVGVVNVSLAGPPNAIVERIVAMHIAGRGEIVAAVGNGGPFSQMIYPAAYPGVIGVTAVDAAGHVYPLATTGAHVDRAAPGVDVSIAVLTGRTVSSGTSWAAPVIAAVVARDAPTAVASRTPPEPQVLPVERASATPE